MIKFRARIHKPGDEPNGWWVVTVPPIAYDQLGKTRRVRGTIANEPFSGAILPAGNSVHFINAKRDICKRAGVGPGNVVEVTLEPDPKANVVDVPTELLRKLNEKPALKKTFNAFSPSHRREFAQWIASAKRAETREVRATKALAMIFKRDRP